jgi:protein SCO1/2
MARFSILKKIIILAIVLLLPGFLYYLLTVKGKNRYEPLSYFGPKQVAKTSHRVKGKIIPDTIYHAIPDFNLTDQYGKPVSFKNYPGKIFVVNFFYSHCPDICSQVNKNLSGLADEYAKNSMIYFLSITVDPKRDTIGALKDYAGKFNSIVKMDDATGGISVQARPLNNKVKIPNHWLFLTGDTSIIYPLARNGFLVNAAQGPNGSFIYDDKVILVDSHKHIRGFYSGTSNDDITRLQNEIKVQVSEELRNSSEALY